MSHESTDQFATMNGQALVAWRLVPEKDHALVPAGQQALLVRTARPERALPPGRHRARGFFQPKPELYLYPTHPLFLPLWITGLTTADGKAANLSWRVQVQVADARTLWDAWLRHQTTDAIPLPADQVSARLTDPAQALMQRYNLDDLRSDAQVRRFVAGKLSLLLKEHLAAFGLEIGAQFDPEQMRFQSEADLALAVQERESLRRMMADEALKTRLNALDNAEALAYRLREWQAEQQVTLSEETITQVVQQMVQQEEQSAGEAMAQVLQKQQATAPLDRATPAVAELSPSVHQGRWHVLRHLSQFVAIATILVAVVLATIAYFEPQLLATADGRNRTVILVAGVAFLGIFIAWTIDQVMRWEAQRAAQRLLRDAEMNHEDLNVSRLELRHLLILLAAFLGVIAAGVALWLPEYYHWFRLGGAAVGLLGAGYVIRLDWLRNVEQSHQVVAQAQRRVASARLSAPRRERIQRKAQANLEAEARVVSTRLGETASLVYRNLRDRPLYGRVQRLQKQVEGQLPAIAAMAQAGLERSDGEWTEMDAHIQRLQTEAQRCSRLAQEAYTFAQQRQSDELVACVGKLEQATFSLDDLLAQWKAVIV